MDARARGFTLLEVLIAVLMIGVLLPTLLLNSANRNQGMKVMEDRMLANMVAQNRLALVRLGVRWSGGRPSREEDGEDELAGRVWFWRLRTDPTEVPGYYRVTLEVRAERRAREPLVSPQAYFGVGEG